jgi:hypothetical protein
MNVLKWVWHVLFDDRYFTCRRLRAVNLWSSWHPHIGLNFDFSFEFILPHKADLDDERDMSWGPEFKFGFGLLWIDFGLTIPNDDHPDNDIEMPPHYCRSCGRTTSPTISDRCDGCGKHVDSCPCDAVPNNEGTVRGTIPLIRSGADYYSDLHRILMEPLIYPPFPSIRVAKR